MAKVTTIHAGTIGINGESADAARMGAIESDLTTLLARPVITELADVPNVDDTGIQDDETLIYDSSANGGLGGYVPGVPAVQTGTIAEIHDMDGFVEGDVSTIRFRQGLGVFGGADDGVVDVYVNLASVQGNHWNSNTNRTIDGAGTTTLASGTLPLADGVTYKCFCIGYFEGYSNLSGPSGVTITIRLGGASSTSETLVTEGGVNSPKLRFATTNIVGQGTSVTFAIDVTWVSGDTRIENAQCAALAIPLIPV